jgi:hypothetical protein
MTGLLEINQSTRVRVTAVPEPGGGFAGKRGPTVRLWRVFESCCLHRSGVLMFLTAGPGGGHARQSRCAGIDMPGPFISSGAGVWAAAAAGPGGGHAGPSRCGGATVCSCVGCAVPAACIEVRGVFQLCSPQGQVEAVQDTAGAEHLPLLSFQPCRGVSGSRHHVHSWVSKRAACVCHPGSSGHVPVNIPV